VNKFLAITSSVIFAVFGTYASATDNKELVTTDYNTFYETQVNNSDCGGYWDERTVRVCDYRTELVDVVYKKCHYQFKTGISGSFPEWETRTVKANNSCPSSWTVGKPSKRGPLGVYIYQYDTTFTQQEPKTVAFNCRWESRSVWVPVNGRDCPLIPQH
jgi:hypothetical protein